MDTRSAGSEEAIFTIPSDEGKGQQTARCIFVEAGEGFGFVCLDLVKPTSPCSTKETRRLWSE